jgi:hypothetical protein
LKRILTKTLVKNYNGASILLSYTESDESMALNIFYAGYRDDYYFVPPASITIKNEISIKQLNSYLTRLDRNDELFDDSLYEGKKEAPPTHIHPFEPIQVCYISNGFLTIAEADTYSENGYKPTKLISFNYEQAKGLYSFLHYIFGSPIHLQKRNGKAPEAKTDHDHEHETEGTESENIEPVKTHSGWDLIK